jgi:hypothetical protein
MPASRQAGVPTTRNILPQDNLKGIIFVYRHLPIDEKISPLYAPVVSA